MATLALAAVGAAAGSALLPAGLTVLGTTLTGATIGAQLGAMAGSMIDNALLGGRARNIEGPRLNDLHVTASTEGAPIPRLYGRARIGGQIIWATNLEEEVVTEKIGGGGKGGFGSRPTRSEYRYYANLAIGLSEGPIASLGRIWADGRELDITSLTTRLYLGNEHQLPDSLIEAKEGSGRAPAFRGLAYIVFERLPLADFGNRIPQFSFEVHRPVDDVMSRIPGVVLIPGSGEFVYATERVVRTVGRTGRQPENVYTSQGATDWQVSLDQMQSALPNAQSVSLVVSWFGTSLDAAQCALRPGVDTFDKTTTPLTWSVAGEARSTAHLISQIDGRAAYGGTPSDQTVIAAITDLKARGLSVVLSPFILMDVPADNTLTDPYTGATGQPAYPWRGRITASPAPGQTGTPDKTAAAATALQSFVGSAQPSDFTITDSTITYTGPAEWSFRRFILHHAALAKAAGGVDAFVLCSELRGLTQIRSSASHYPFVAALVTLAADVRAMLGPGTKITYAADWSEYFGHQPADGSGDVYFHLDPLWSSPNIDAIGIDCYWPLSDWRDGLDHFDAIAGARSIYDLAYLTRNVAGGEGVDWDYASDADRAAQNRTPITDGAGKPWVFRYKDIRSWWLSQHFNRPGGTESATPTAWQPQSKPFWFLEIGCPAVDKGTNQPNVFVDPKSSESFFPHFSNRSRDDAIQRRAIEAMFEAFDLTRPFAIPEINPLSTVYDAPMVDLSRMHVYCWDARPWPAFPHFSDVWADGENWRLGHWINGRATAVSLAGLVEAILTRYGVVDFDTSELAGLVPGYILDRTMSARQALEPLELAYFFDSLETGGGISFRHRGAAPTLATLTDDNLVETRPGAPLRRLVRAQETELPQVSKIHYIASTGNFHQSVAEARRLSGLSTRTAAASLPIVLDHEHAGAIAETVLHEAWSLRERAAFHLPPSALALEPGDLLILQTAPGIAELLRINTISDSTTRRIEARRIDPRLYPQAPTPVRNEGIAPPPALGQPQVLLLDLPRLDEAHSEHALYAAASQKPWPGAIAVLNSRDETGFTLKGLLSQPATTGVTLSPLGLGQPWRLDYSANLEIELDRGELVSATEQAFLAGANSAALETTPGVWELLQFRTAALIAPHTYRLSGLLRGQFGSELAAQPCSAGARLVLIDSAVRPLETSLEDVGIAFHWLAGPAARDIGDADYIPLAHTIAGRGLKPLSPVHARGSRDTEGNLSISFIRRTRTGGDSWDGIDVPLGEAIEAYQIDILDGATVTRTFTVGTPGVIYTAADQTTDFGSPQSAISLRIAQLSQRLGPGDPLLDTL